VTDLTKCYRPNDDDLASTIIDGDAVLVNLATGVYYSLDGAAGAVWQMIEEGHSLAEIAVRLPARYQTDAAQALADVEKLAAKLLDEKLIVMTDIRVAPAAEPARDHLLPYLTPELNVYTDMSDLLALDPPMPGLREIPLNDRR
jgi:Coenzyme PQQ synthesis protein D (PqqD)